MKKLFTIVCSAALINLGVSAAGQAQDSVLARNDASKEIRPKKKSENKKHDAALGTKETLASDVSGNETRGASKISKRSTRNNKVGSTGAVHLKRSKYYLDEQGHKVKARSARLKDKPKHS